MERARPLLCIIDAEREARWLRWSLSIVSRSERVILP